MSNVRMHSTSPDTNEIYDYDSDSDEEHDITLVVTEEEYTRDSPLRHKVIHIPEEQSSRGVSTQVCDLNYKSTVSKVSC